MSNLDTVKQIYEAFEREDIDQALAQLAPDCKWEHHPTGNTAQDRDVPYMRLRRGPEGAAAFFRDIDDDFEMHVFRPHTFLEGAGVVATVVEYELTVKSTGKRVHDEEIHFWQFGPDGKIVAFRHFLDTAKAIEAHAC
jgi:uncharacterized protein